MDINNISSSANLAIRNSGEPPSRVARNENGERGEPARGRKADDGQLFKALEKTLSDLGLAPSASSRPPVATASQANDLETANSNSAQNAAQALPAFMSALFQALNPNGGNPPARNDNDRDDKAAPSDAGNSAARGKNAYGDLTSRLQNLVQSLSTPNNGGSATTGGQSTNLETSFRNLALALQGKTSPASTPQSAPDLQSFLKTLAQNLNSAGSTLDSSGNLINTEA